MTIGFAEVGPSTSRTLQRVWAQRSQLARLSVRIEDFTIHVSFDVWQDLVREARDADRPPGRYLDHVSDVLHGRGRMFGLPVVPDESLRPDSVVLRYEVIA